MKQNKTPTVVIGVTGGVGCGKSEALDYMERHYAARAIRADEVGRRLMRFGGRCFQPVLHLFGNDVLNPGGELDRGKIAEKVFADRALLDRLNAVIHPAVREEITADVERARAEGGRLVLIEAALLLEEHYDEICDQVWYIRADEDVRRARLKASRGYTDEKITAIMRNQLPEEVFRERCAVVIDNSGDLDELKLRIDEQLAAARAQAERGSEDGN